MREIVRTIGQRFVIGFEGLRPSIEVKQLLREYGVGGIILFARNVDEPGQLVDLVRELQFIARETGHETPLLIGVDQEGGRVARLHGPWTRWPAARALGRTGSEGLAREMGSALARELRSCGIRCDFAPVMDVDSNPNNPVIGDRSFGDDPELVGRIGSAMIRGLQNEEVAACAKHFPGHGDTDKDSHLDLPCLTHARERLDAVELRPFRDAIAAEVAMIMTAHIVVSALDDGVPATLSRRVIDDLLRIEMGYDGVIVSDDLEMKAVGASWSAERAAILAAQAGCDLLLICHTPDAQAAAVEGLIHAVEKGDLRRDSLEESARRIRALKRRYCAHDVDPDPRAARRAAGLSEHHALARRIAENGAHA
ncbi:MAG: beta-N-acetylhexosaminidase [Vicinamibacteria bacterium]|nr:beta-N-acetylhexosaminidase [Vicinamibacteria bacterium]